MEACSSSLMPAGSTSVMPRRRDYDDELRPDKRDDDDELRPDKRKEFFIEDDMSLSCILLGFAAGYGRSSLAQQAFLPSVNNPRLGKIKCAVGHQREAVVWPRQRCMGNYEEAHVGEACKDLRTVSLQTLVPIKEVTDVPSVGREVVDSTKKKGRKVVDIHRDMWVQMKIGKYKGDLAKVVMGHNLSHKATVKLIPRIDLQTLANKLEGREVVKKKAFVPPPRFMNLDEARSMHISVERKWGSITRDSFEAIDNMLFKDGFLYKTIWSHNIQPVFAVNEKDRRKYFKIGDYVKVVSGAQKGKTGMVVKMDDHVLYISSDTTKEDICVFADNVDCFEVTAGITKIGDYELHDLVLLDNMSFGVILRVERGAFQVLKGIPERPEVALVQLREIKSKIERKANARDCSNKVVFVKDVARIMEGPCKVGDVARLSGLKP